MRRETVLNIATYLEEEFSWEVNIPQFKCPNDPCLYTTKDIDNNYCPRCGIELELEIEEKRLDELQKAIETCYE